MISVIVRTPRGDTLCDTPEQVSSIVTEYLTKYYGHGNTTIHKVYGECGWGKSCEHQMRNKSSDIMYCRNHIGCGNCFKINGTVVLLSSYRK